MKGTPEAPRCGFSARVVQRLEHAGAELRRLDVLVDARIRQVLSGWSNWPTIPQLFVDGQLVGGCDIVEELAESGELPGVLQGAPARLLAAETGSLTRVSGLAPGRVRSHTRLGHGSCGMQEVSWGWSPGQTGWNLLAKPE